MNATRTTLKHLDIQTNGIRLHAVEAGPANGRLLILLHGFPEFWYGWRRQIDDLAAQGFRLIIPDQRGYNLSDKPKAISAYRMDNLAADIIGLIDHYKQENALLLGHDWGAMAAWWTTLQYPERVDKLAVLNVPHPLIMRRHLLKNRVQRKKSWYIFFFQIPWLPEYWYRKNDYKMGRISLAKTSLPDTFNEEDLGEYVTAWSRPGALTAMINWYRAAMWRPGKLQKTRVSRPTLLLWGTGDRFLGRELAQPSIDLCDQGQLVFVEKATHWLHHEVPDEVNPALVDFFKA